MAQSDFINNFVITYLNQPTMTYGYFEKILSKVRFSSLFASTYVEQNDKLLEKIIIRNGEHAVQILENNNELLNWINYDKCVGFIPDPIICECIKENPTILTSIFDEAPDVFKPIIKKYMQKYNMLPSEIPKNLQLHGDLENKDDFVIVEHSLSATPSVEPAGKKQLDELKKFRRLLKKDLEGCRIISGGNVYNRKEIIWKMLNILSTPIKNNIRKRLSNITVKLPLKDIDKIDLMMNEEGFDIYNSIEELQYEEAALEPDYEKLTPKQQQQQFDINHKNIIEYISKISKHINSDRIIKLEKIISELNTNKLIVWVRSNPVDKQLKNNDDIVPELESDKQLENIKKEMGTALDNIINEDTREVGFKSLKEIGKQIDKEMEKEKYDEKILEREKEKKGWDTLTHSDLGDMYNMFQKEIIVWEARKGNTALEKVDQLNLKIIRLNRYIGRRNIKEEDERNLKIQEMEEQIKEQIKTSTSSSSEAEFPPMHFEFLIAKSTTMNYHKCDIIKYYRKFIRDQIILQRKNVTCRVSLFDDKCSTIFAGTLFDALLPDHDEFKLCGTKKKLYSSINKTIGNLREEIAETLNKPVGWKTHPYVWFIIISDGTSDTEGVFYSDVNHFIEQSVHLLLWNFAIIGKYDDEIFSNITGDKYRNPIEFYYGITMDPLGNAMGHLSESIIKQRKKIYENNKHWIGNT